MGRKMSDNLQPCQSPSEPRRDAWRRPRVREPKTEDRQGSGGAAELREDLLVEEAVRREPLPSLEAPATTEVGDPSAGLLHDDPRRREVPRMEVLLQDGL